MTFFKLYKKSFLKDKEFFYLLYHDFRRKSSILYETKFHSKRTCLQSLKELLQGRERDSGIQATAFESVREALVSALAVADPNDLVVVFGSFFTVAEAREILLAGKVAGS